MNNLKSWLKKNGVNSLLILSFIVILVNPDAKAWLLKQVASTGILNRSIKEKPVETTSDIHFSVMDESGKRFSTADAKGKVVFINFWASWCPPCRAEFPSIQQFYTKYQNNPNLIFLTVNLDDDVQLGKNYLANENFSIPFLTSGSSIPEEVFNGSLPTTVILDKEGKIRMHHKGVADYSTSRFFKQIDELLAE